MESNLKFILVAFLSSISNNVFSQQGHTNTIDSVEKLAGTQLSCNNTILYFILILLLVISIVEFICLLSIRRKNKSKSEQTEQQKKSIIDSCQNLETIINAEQLITWIFEVKDKKIINNLCESASQKSLFSNYDELVKAIHPKDLEEVNSIYNNILERKNNYHDTVIRFLVKPQVYRYFRLTFTPIVENAEVVRIICSLKDIDNQHKGKKTDHDLIMCFDLALNATGITVWNYDLQKDIIIPIKGTIYNSKVVSRQDFFDKIHPDDKASIIEIFNKILNGDYEKGCTTFRYLTSTGEYRYFKNFYIVKKEEGAITSIVGARIDITEEYLAEKEKNDLNTKLDLALEAGEVSVWILDAESRCFYPLLKNPIAEKELTWDDNLRILHPDDIEIQVSTLNNLLSGKTNKATCSYRYIHQDGTYHYYKSVMLANFSGGKVVSVIGTQKDITESVVYQEKLESLITKDNQILFNMNSAIAFVDNNYIIKWQNEKINKISKQLNNKIHYSIGKPCYHNEFRFIDNCEDCALKKSFKSLKNEKKIIKYNDKTFEQTSIPIFDDNNKLLGAILQIDDITEKENISIKLKNLIHKLRFSIKTANMTMFEYNVSTHTYTTYNDPVNNYTDSQDITEEDFSSFSNKEDLEKQEYLDYLNIINNGINAHFKFSVRMKIGDDSEWQYCVVQGAPSEFDHNGKVTRYIGMRKNDTENIHIQNVLKKEKNKALEAARLKSAFLANMSHEIRTPLNAIVGFSELIQNTDNPAEKAEYMKIVNQNNELLLRLIGDILDLSKIEAGLSQFKKEIFNLSEVFNDSYKSLKQRIVKNCVELICKNDYKKCIVNLDKNRIIQVYTNFVTNAIKYTPSGQIIMGYEYIDNGIKFFVSDTGIGIAKEKQHLIFQRFEKLDTFAQGTGIGLAICKAIIDSMDGKIGFSSEVGKGSTFWAWIPCKANITN